jgi:hypothetical protein
MSTIEELSAAYERHITTPWDTRNAPVQRVILPSTIPPTN